VGALGSTACAEFTAIDGIPPSSISDLRADVFEREVRLSWTEPGEPGLRGSLIVRFPTSGPDWAPESGFVYAVGDSLGSGEAIFAESGTEVVDLPPCTQHVYAGWAQDGAGNWSLQAETVRVTGVTAALPPAPTGLRATANAGRVDLSWTPSIDARATSVRVVRKRTGPPANATDGETVYTGSGTSATDATAELSPLVTWRYAAYSCNPCAECEPAGSHAEVTPTLMQSLRAGGFVIYWRHGAATTCDDQQSSTVPEWWKSCDRNCSTATARQLNSPLGVEQAQAIGQALRQRSIPFARVISSEYCRCRETAQHMNLGPMIETSSQVTFFVYPEIEPCGAIRTQLSTAPAPGTNTAIVAHVHPQCMIEMGLDLTLDNGQAAVYRPNAMGNPTLIAKVRYDEWASLP
jgi:phosphohistidine phosphatase SixA